MKLLLNNILVGLDIVLAGCYRKPHINTNCAAPRVGGTIELHIADKNIPVNVEWGIAASHGENINFSLALLGDSDIKEALTGFSTFGNLEIDHDHITTTLGL